MLRVKTQQQKVGSQKRQNKLRIKTRYLVGLVLRSEKLYRVFARKLFLSHFCFYFLLFISFLHNIFLQGAHSTER